MQAKPFTDMDSINTVWAEEGGTMVSIRRSPDQPHRVLIEIYENVHGVENKPTAAATLANFRWERLVEWLDKERPS